VRDEEIELSPAIVTALLSTADACARSSRHRGGRQGARPRFFRPDRHSESAAEWPSGRCDLHGSSCLCPRRTAPVVTASEETAIVTRAPAATAPFPPATRNVASPVPAVTVAPHREAMADGAEPRAASVVDSNLRVDVALLDKLMNLVASWCWPGTRCCRWPRRRRSELCRRRSAVEPDHHRAAVRFHEDPDATHSQYLGKASPRRARHGPHVRKKARVEMQGSETELDRTIIEAIKDPLTHLVRNCIDHGSSRRPSASQHTSRPKGGCSCAPSMKVAR